MKFDLSEDQLALRTAVADYLADTCPMPVTLAAHEAPARDREIWEGLMALGVGGVNIPAEHGGMGLGMLELAVMAEAVGRFAAPGRFFPHALATQALILSSNEAEKAEWLPKLASGEALATVALAEGAQRWLAEEWTMAAADTLTGRKLYVPVADEADLFIVGVEGGGLVLVEAGAAGVAIAAMPTLDGGRPLFEVTFDNSPCRMLADADGARLCDAGLILLSADAVGGASYCVDSSVDYAKEREQFGRQIASFQAVKHQLADMAVEVEPTVGLFWHAANIYDENSLESAQFSALAKAHLTDLYAAMARRMIEMHGGIGYTWEFAAHVWLKRSVFDRAFLGTPSYHRARYAQLAGW